MDTYQELIDAAPAARERAYAPYSHFQVGAALRGVSGRIYQGCNVENVSYGLTSCAERNAVFHAVAEGERRFSAVAVVTGAATPTPPCGACRQVLAEFAADGDAADGDMAVILATLDGQVRQTRLSTLLPESFDHFEPG